MFSHLRLYVAGGVSLSVLLTYSIIIATHSVDGFGFVSLEVWGIARLVLFQGFAAAALGLLQIPILGWLGRQAGQRRWSIAELLLASVGLFLALILPLFLLAMQSDVEEPIGKDFQLVLLLGIPPFLISYVLATYWLRRPLCQPQPAAA